MPIIQIETGPREPSPKRPKRKDAPRNESPTGGAEPRTFNVGWFLVGLVAIVLVVVGGYWLGTRAGGGSLAGLLRGGGPLAGLLPGGGGAAGGAQAPGDPLALVNGQAVTVRDIDVEAAVQRVLQAQTGRILSEEPAAQASFRRELLSQVVDQVLLSQAAVAAGVNPTDAEVEADLPRLVGQYGLDGATLKQNVLAQGITDAEFLGWARRQVGNGRYLQSPSAQQLAGGMAADPEQVAAVLRRTSDVVLYFDGEPVRPVKEGEPAPDFTLQTPDGASVKLSDFRGKPVMVNFWATWCGPCKIEMPLFVDAYNKHGGDLVVLGVDVQEQPELVKQFAQQYGLTFPLVIDPNGDIATIYQVRGLPTTVFVGADGVVAAAHRGAILSRPQLEPYIAMILPGATP